MRRKKFRPAALKTAFFGVNDSVIRVPTDVRMLALEHRFTNEPSMNKAVKCGLKVGKGIFNFVQLDVSDGVNAPRREALSRKLHG